MDEELEEILMSLVDFQAFKKLMLDFKDSRNLMELNDDKLNRLSLKG
jgi:hypothetical protein